MKNIKVGTTVILPGHQMVEGLKKRYEKFQLQFGDTQEMFVGLDASDFPKLLAALYQDTFENFAHWSPNQGGDVNYHRLMQEVHPQWMEVSTKQQNQFYRAVVQPAMDELMEWVCQLDRDEDRWRVWYVKQLGNDILIEKGPDFRIVDWERRMEQAADYLAMKEEGEELPASAWIPDEGSLHLIRRRKRALR